MKNLKVEKMQNNNFILEFNIREALYKERMPQIELSRITGISTSRINEYYHGYAKTVTLWHVQAICKVLNCEIEDVFIWREYN